MFYFFQDKFPKINEVVISSNSDTKIEGTKFIIKLQDFEKLDELSKERDEVEKTLEEKNERYLELLEIEES